MVDIKIGGDVSGPVNVAENNSTITTTTSEKPQENKNPFRKIIDIILNLLPWTK